MDGNVIMNVINSEERLIFEEVKTVTKMIIDGLLEKYETDFSEAWSIRFDSVEYCDTYTELIFSSSRKNSVSFITVKVYSDTFTIMCSLDNNSSMYEINSIVSYEDFEEYLADKVISVVSHIIDVIINNRNITRLSELSTIRNITYFYLPKIKKEYHIE